MCAAERIMFFSSIRFLGIVKKDNPRETRLRFHLYLD